LEEPDLVRRHTPRSGHTKDGARVLAQPWRQVTQFFDEVVVGAENAEAHGARRSHP
jgi:hypothetical protein